MLITALTIWQPYAIPTNFYVKGNSSEIQVEKEPEADGFVVVPNPALSIDEEVANTMNDNLSNSVMEASLVAPFTQFSCNYFQQSQVYSS